MILEITDTHIKLRDGVFSVDDFDIDELQDMRGRLETELRYINASDGEFMKMVDLIVNLDRLISKKEREVCA